jgi:putative ABC transport system permease protein
VILIAGGLVAGAAGAAALTRSLEGQLFGVRPTDPLVLSLTIAILGIVALAACAVQYRRAARRESIQSSRSPVEGAFSQTDSGDPRTVEPTYTIDV